MKLSIVAVAVLLVSTACSERLVGNLDEPAANALVSKLQSNGYSANKVEAGRSFEVHVASGELAAAWPLVAAEVPSQEETPGTLFPRLNQAELDKSLALERSVVRTLEALEGVESASVHLDVDYSLSLARAPKRKNSKATVVIRQTGPVAREKVTRLLVHQVPRLEPDDILLETVQVPAQVSPARAITKLGPWFVAAESRTYLRWTLLSGALACLFLGGTNIFLFLRYRERHA